MLLAMPANKSKQTVG